MLGFTRRSSGRNIQFFNKQKQEGREGTIKGTNGSIHQSNRRKSFAHPTQQKKTSSPSTSSQSSPPRTTSKPPPCHSRCPVSTATPTRTRPGGRARPSTSSDLREEERQKWRTFREKKRSYRSAVVGLHPRKPRHNPSEPSKYGALPQLPLPHCSELASFIRLSSSCAVQ